MPAMSALNSTSSSPLGIQGLSSVDGNHSLAHLAALLPVAELCVEEDGAAELDLADDAFRFRTLNEVARILCRSKRGHVLLTGQKGVGKSSQLAFFASYVQKGRFPLLKNYRLIRIDVSNVGPEDSRACLEAIFAAFRQTDNVILCLDGIATLMKRGNGGTNKPLLRALISRGGLRIIGTITPWEYAEHVGGDAQMLDLFDRVELHEPTGRELDEIVRHAAARLATQFEVEIRSEVSERAIALTSTFLLSECQPAKSIDVLRQVCEDMTYERLQWGQTRSQVRVDDVHEVISRRTGIPCETISGRGRECDFAKALTDAVVGQEQAVREVAMELQLISAGLNEPGKPASVMMFAGMTGVGKTELAKRVAELYSSSRRLHVYTMGNFTEPHSVSGIIGVPPGYVGHEEGGRLINELRADPYSVFLLDEAEKCHPNVWKPFLNLFDEGWIADQRGVKAYADRAIFILTTNAGDRNIAQLVRTGKSEEEISQNVRQALSRVRQERSSQPVFPPQFLSRMKRIIVFNPLDEPAMIGIVERVSRRLCGRWKTARDREVTLDPELVRQIGIQAHELNERANGQEGGRIVQKLFSDLIDHALLQESIAHRDLYERHRRITVAIEELRSGNSPMRVRVTFS